jgi:hypothetical protein
VPEFRLNKALTPGKSARFCKNGSIVEMAGCVDYLTLCYTLLISVLGRPRILKYCPHCHIEERIVF